MTVQDRLQRALTDAIAVGDTQSIRRLVEKGADLKHRDQLRRTPLILAALQGINGPAVVTVLVELGADVDAQNNNGRTALVEALSRDDLPMATALINSGANPTLMDKNGRQAISYAGARTLQALERVLSKAESSPPRKSR